MAKLVIEVDTEATTEIRITVDGEQLVELPHQFTLSIHEGTISGHAHFWQPENHLRYLRYGDSFETSTPVSAGDLETAACWRERQDVVAELLKRLPFIKRWLFEMKPMPTRPSEKL